MPFEILFVGNSHTYVHDVPGLVRALAKAAGRADVHVTRVLRGGAQLATHWEEGEARRLVEGTRFDFVVLQEQSQTPCFLPATYERAMADFGRAALAERPDLALYSEGGNHAAAAGAYLAACVFHAVIHRESPAGLPAELTPQPVGTGSGDFASTETIRVSEADASFLQAVAWRTAEAWRRRTKAWFLRVR